MARSSGDGDDFDFANEMAKRGVVPLGSRTAGQQSGKKSGRHGRRSAGPARVAGKPRLAPPMPADPDPRTTPLQTVTEAELAELRHALAVEGEARKAAEDALAREHETLEAERAAAETRRKTWDTERTELHAERKALQRQLAEARQAAETRIPLRQLLEARGCINSEESIAVLRMLLDERPGDFLDAIVLASNQPLADVLEDRVALVAEGLDLDRFEGLDPGSGCAVLRVPPERCEIGGGSDIRTEFRRFSEAARKAGVTRVTIVGGSPAYRKQLKALAGCGDLKLTLVPGNRRRERRRAESDVRSSDLVVIWGATELDHSVSDVYTQKHDAELLRVPHRGISLMLGYVAEVLCKRLERDKQRSSQTPGEKASGPDRKKRRKPKKR